jgi:hypothetical protein
MNGWWPAAVTAGMLDGEDRFGGRQQREDAYYARLSKDGDTKDPEAPGTPL